MTSYNHCPYRSNVQNYLNKKKVTVAMCEYGELSKKKNINIQNKTKQ